MTFISWILRFLFGRQFLQTIKYLVTAFMGRLVVGLLLLIGGLVYGSFSHQIHFIKVNAMPVGRAIASSTADQYYLDAGNGYYYSIASKNFGQSPGSLGFDNQTKLISLVYSDEPHTFHVTLSNQTTVNGNYYDVISVHFLPADSQQEQVLENSYYTAHPDGYFVNNWIPWGAILIGAGLVVILVSIVYNKLTAAPKPKFKINTQPRIFIIPD